jgi:hypothetical protein
MMIPNACCILGEAHFCQGKNSELRACVGTSTGKYLSVLDHTGGRWHQPE